MHATNVQYFVEHYGVGRDMYGGGLRPCKKKIILFPQYNIMFPQERYFVPTT
jgi:hypothetical protein